jgi:hypothetical protein
MLRSTLLFLAAAIHHINAQAVDANGITLYEKVEAIERQLLDPFTLNSLVSPCSVNFGDDPNRGEQTSAQWVRIVFHDAITKGIQGPGLGYDSRNKFSEEHVLTTTEVLMHLSALNPTGRRTLVSSSMSLSSNSRCSPAPSSPWPIL